MRYIKLWGEYMNFTRGLLHWMLLRAMCLVIITDFNSNNITDAFWWVLAAANVPLRVSSVKLSCDAYSPFVMNHSSSSACNWPVLLRHFSPPSVCLLFLCSSGTGLSCTWCPPSTSPTSLTCVMFLWGRSISSHWSRSPVWLCSGPSNPPSWPSSSRLWCEIKHSV